MDITPALLQISRGTGNSYKKEENDCKYDYRYYEGPNNVEKKARTAEFMEGGYSGHLIPVQKGVLHQSQPGETPLNNHHSKHGRHLQLFLFKPIKRFIRHPSISPHLERVEVF